MFLHRIILLVVLFIANFSFVFGSQEHQLTRRSGSWTSQEDFKTKKPLYKVINECEQREDWYARTPHVAELWCTLTSLPIVFVAGKYMLEKPIGASGLMYAGLASAVSHAIPRDWLHKNDHTGAFTSIPAMAYDCNLLSVARLVAVAHNPVILACAVATGSLYVVDVAVAHAEKLKLYRRKWQTPLHCSWHLSVALLAYILFFYSVQQTI